MSDLERPPFPIEAEKADLEKVDLETSSGDGKADSSGIINIERARLLANLPDPDAGKSEEERREIVSWLISRLQS